MLVSVVIPCYNAALFVERAVSSALEQEGVEVEVILVDNNSTDNTAEVLQALATQYSGQIRVASETIPTASAARNKGWRMACSEYIQFLDADDELLPGKLARQVSLLSDGTAMIIGTSIYIDLEGNQTMLRPWQDAFKGLAHGMYSGSTNANFYTKSILEKVNGWDASLPDTQDVDLVGRLLMQDVNYALDLEPCCLCFDREHNKLSRRDPIEIIERHLALRYRIIAFLQENKTDYWVANEDFFYLAAYRYLRMLASKEPALAQYYYSKYLPKHFRLLGNELLRIPKWEALLVNQIGLKQYASIKNGLKYVFPSRIWRMLGNTFKPSAPN